MGDHFVLLVDRLITESTIQAALESRSQSETPSSSTIEVEMDFSCQKRDSRNTSTPGKLVECRICQDEDVDSSMESPCACCGSLKYAHRRCVQRWCNEKGDTTCEICHQQFKPGFKAPPQLFQYGGIPMNFRGNWEISRRDLNNSRFIPMVATDRNYTDPDYDDYSHDSRSLICCCSIAVIFMVLLVLRHTFPIILTGADEYSFTIVIMLVSRTAGILLPVYIMARTFAAIQRRRHRQVSRELPVASEQTLC